MRTVLLIATAGLTWLTPVSQARAQYYGWGYYGPYYPIPYGYYQAPYYAPPPVYNAPSRPSYRHYSSGRTQHRTALRRDRVSHRPLVNPLLGPLPGAAFNRRY